MFDLEQTIADWRQQMLAAGIKTPVPLEELEIHLREEIEQQMKSGLDGQRAFEIAVRKTGQANALKNEFKKITVKTKYLNQRLGDISIMKTLNWKVTILAFTTFAIIDATLLIFSFLPLFHGKLLSIAWCIFNAPGIPLAMICEPLVPQEPVGFVLLSVFVVFFSSLVWSVIGGFIFRRKHVA